MMIREWQELTKLTHGTKLVAERISAPELGVTIEGSFELPRLAELGMDDQVFVQAFLQTHGSIKEMERLFGVSYPTIKSRLVRINEKLGFVETNPPATKAEVLAQLERGEISVTEALERMKS